MNIKSIESIYGKSAHYVDDDSAAAIEGLPIETWPALVAACEEIVGGTQPGIDCDVAKTSETLDQWDTARDDWSECGQRNQVECGGQPAIVYYRIQVRKGDPRRDLIVVDCGEFRAVLC